MKIAWNVPFSNELNKQIENAYDGSTARQKRTTENDRHGSQLNWKFLSKSHSQARISAGDHKRAAVVAARTQTRAYTHEGRKKTPRTNGNWEAKQQKREKGKMQRTRPEEKREESQHVFSSSEEFDNLPPVRLKSVGRVVRGVRRWKLAVGKKNGRL